MYSAQSLSQSSFVCGATISKLDNIHDMMEGEVNVENLQYLRIFGLIRSHPIYGIGITHSLLFGIQNVESKCNNK